MQKEGEPRMSGRQRSKPPCELLDAHNTTSTASARRLLFLKFYHAKQYFKRNMVLAELGRKISTALRGLNNKSTIDEKVLKQLLNEISRALMDADVSLTVIKEIRDNIKNIVSMEELAAGTNKQKIIQEAVFKELVRMINPEKEPYKLKRGKRNVVMFVGLQGSGKTTSIAKYANYYNKKGWRTCMVCADTFSRGCFRPVEAECHSR